MEEIALELAEYGVNIRVPESSRCLVPANMSTKSQSKLNSKNTSFNEKSPLIDLHEMMF